MTEATEKTQNHKANKPAPKPRGLPLEGRAESVAPPDRFAVTFVNKAGIEQIKYFDSKDKAYGFKAGLAACDVTASVTNVNKKSKTAKSK